MIKRSFVLLLSVFLILFCIQSCNCKRSSRHAAKQNKTPFTSEQYSDCSIDSDFVKNELLRDTSLRPYAEDILTFYQRRNYEAAWLNEDTLTLSAHDLLNTLTVYESEFGDSTIDEGLDPADIGAMMMSGMTRGYTKLDLKLTATFFKFAHKQYGGTDADLKGLEWYIPRNKKDYQRLIDTLVTSPGIYSEYEPVNSYYKALKKVLVQYRQIERKGGWPLLKLSKRTLRAGDSTDDVMHLKKALIAMGDYNATDTEALYNDRLTAAVLRYQGRTGLRETGVVDSLTVAEINTPIETRIRQIMLNMERLRWLPDLLPENYILVNIPEYRLHVYEAGIDTLSMDVVVGKAASATSIFTGRLSVVAIDPYWNVPQSIIKHEMLPILKRNPGYLAKNHMEVLSRGVEVNPWSINWNKYTKGVPFDIRQKPGPDCALGLLAFFFPNSFDIYLHDTPAKSFFNESTRAFSHGCIRLSEPKKLADYIFRNDTTMTPDHIAELMTKHVERKFPVRPSIRVYIVYFTAWVDPMGRVNFRHDIYGHDGRLAREIFGAKPVL